MHHFNFTQLDREFVGGVVGPEAAPHVAVVLGNNTGAVCTGSLIALDIVLTLARCLFHRHERKETRDSIMVLAGVGSLGNLSGQSTVQQELVDRLFIHPNFKISAKDPYFGYNDILLIMLERPFKQTFAVKPIQVSYIDWSSDGNEGVQCVLVGYDSINPVTPSLEDDLLKMYEVRVSKQCQCHLSLERSFGSRIKRWICIEPSEIERTPCVGSAGAGLICEDKLVAITAGLIPFSDLGQCIYQHQPVVTCRSDTSLTVFLELCPYMKWMNYHFREMPDGPENCPAGQQQSKKALSVSTLLLCILLSGINK